MTYKNIFKKPSIVGLFVTCLASPLIANSEGYRLPDNASIEKDSGAMSELINRLEPVKHFSGNFTQKVFDADGNMLQQGSGTLSISKPNKLNWKTVEPEESIIVSNGETLWFFDPFIEQVTAYNFESAVANTPILLITNNDRSLWDNYTISKSDNRFDIRSRDDEAQVKVLSLYFEGTMISKIDIEDVTGQISKIQLTDINTDKPEPSLFEFVIPEGIELDDQR